MTATAKTILESFDELPERARSLSGTGLHYRVRSALADGSVSPYRPGRARRSLG